MYVFDLEKTYMKTRIMFCMGLLGFLLGGFATPILALDTGSLLSMLTSQLGVSEQQAGGGIGALMDVVKQNLAGSDYTQLIGGAPDLGTLAQSATPPAPEQSSSGWGGLLGSAGSLLGGQHQALGQAAQLTQTFSQLGLSADQVGQFAKIALQYVQGSGGTGLMKILAGALPSF